MPGLEGAFELLVLEEWMVWLDGEDFEVFEGCLLDRLWETGKGVFEVLVVLEHGSG